MSDEIYRQLARVLDSLPPGFAPTEDGLELRVLRALYEPEEALLASVMRSLPEPVTAIAGRAGVHPQVAADLLYAMGRKMLIGTRQVGDQTHYELMPWAVGVIEGQLQRLDRELAELLEAYAAAPKVAGAVAESDPATPFARVIPIGQAVEADIEVLAHQQAEHLLRQARSWGVRECICRKQKRLVGEGCDYPLETCLIMSDREDAFRDSDLDRPLSLDQALAILRATEEAGLLHSVGNYRDEHEFICNCCACCCGILASVVRHERPSAMIRAEFQAALEVEACVGCGTCLDRCPTQALSLADGACQIDDLRCIGCGLCVSACPSGALRLERRPEETLPPMPETRTAWIARRAEERGRPLDRPAGLRWANALVQPPKRHEDA